MAVLKNMIKVQIFQYLVGDFCYNKTVNELYVFINSRLTFVPERIVGWNSKLIVNLKFKFK